MSINVFHRRAVLWGRRATTLSGPCTASVTPPSLRCAPETVWQRLIFWLMAPDPRDAAPPLNRLPGVRADFIAALADVGTRDDACALRERIQQARSLRELWHARAETYRLVGVVHDQVEAERRLARLNRHFPARAPRSQFAPL